MSIAMAFLNGWPETHAALKTERVTPMIFYDWLHRQRDPGSKRKTNNSAAPDLKVRNRNESDV